jgi:20S proteasome subunit beta 6
MESELSRASLAQGGAKGHHWSPYEMNGGTLIGVAGADYVILGSDTRLSEGYSILSREEPHTFPLQPHCMIGCVGFHGDCLTFVKRLEMRLRMYEYENSLKTMTTPAIAQLASTILYYKRFFPYYVKTIVAGISPDGQGAIYSYDPVGCVEREMYR